MLALSFDDDTDRRNNGLIKSMTGLEHHSQRKRELPVTAHGHGTDDDNHCHDITTNTSFCAYMKRNACF